MIEQHAYPYDYPAHDFEPMPDAPTSCQICADFAAEADARTATACPACGRQEPDGTWYDPCPSDDCPSHDEPAERMEPDEAAAMLEVTTRALDLLGYDAELTTIEKHRRGLCAHGNDESCNAAGEHLE